MFFRGDDAGISHSYYVSGGWVGPSEVPGTAPLATSGPGVVVTASGSVINEFFRGTDGGILQTYYKSGHGWRATPVAVPRTGGKATTNPAAALSHSGKEVDVFFRGTDGGLWQSWYIYGVGWHGPAEVPGTAGMVTSGVAADGYHGGIDIYFRGPDAGLYESWHVSGSGWHGPAEIPGTTQRWARPPPPMCSGAAMRPTYSGSPRLGGCSSPITHPVAHGTDRRQRRM